MKNEPIIGPHPLEFMCKEGFTCKDDKDRYTGHSARLLRYACSTDLGRLYDLVRLTDGMVGRFKSIEAEGR